MAMGLSDEDVGLVSPSAPQDNTQQVTPRSVDAGDDNNDTDDPSFAMLNSDDAPTGSTSRQDQVGLSDADVGLGETAPSSSTFGAAARSAVRNVGGLVGGALGGVAGAGFGGGVGAIGGAVAGGVLGANAEDWLLNELGLSQGTGELSDAQAAQDVSQHPWASKAGELADIAVGFGTGKTEGRVASALINAGAEAGNELYNKQFDPVQIAMAAGAGFALNKPRSFLGPAEAAGAQLGEAYPDMANRLRKFDDIFTSSKGVAAENPPVPRDAVVTGTDNPAGPKEDRGPIPAAKVPGEETNPVVAAEAGTPNKYQRFLDQDLRGMPADQTPDDGMVRLGNTNAQTVAPDIQAATAADRNMVASPQVEEAGSVPQNQNVPAEGAGAPAGGANGPPTGNVAAPRPTAPVTGDNGAPAGAVGNRPVQSLRRGPGQVPYDTGLEAEAEKGAAKRLNVKPQQANVFMDAIRDGIREAKRARIIPVDGLPAGMMASKTKPWVYRDVDYPQDLARHTAVHEIVERNLRNLGYSQLEAHKGADFAESTMVKAAGIDPKVYNGQAGAALAQIEKKPWTAQPLAGDQFHATPDEAMEHAQVRFGRGPADTTGTVNADKTGTATSAVPTPRTRAERELTPEQQTAIQNAPPEQRAALAAYYGRMKQNVSGTAKFNPDRTRVEAPRNVTASGNRARSKADAAFKNAAADAWESAADQFGKDKIGDLDPENPAGVKGVAEDMHQAALDRWMANRNQLLKENPKWMADKRAKLTDPLDVYKPQGKGGLPPAYKLVKAARDLKDGGGDEEGDAFMQAHALKGETGQNVDAELGRKVRPSVETAETGQTAKAAEAAREPDRYTFEPYEHETPVKDQTPGEKTAVAQHNALREWANNLTDKDYALMAHEYDVRQEIENTNNPVETQRSMQDDLVEARRRADKLQAINNSAANNPKAMPRDPVKPENDQSSAQKAVSAVKGDQALIDKYNDMIRTGTLPKKTPYTPTGAKEVTAKELPAPKMTDEDWAARKAAGAAAQRAKIFPNEDKQDGLLATIKSFGKDQSGAGYFHRLFMRSPMDPQPEPIDANLGLRKVEPLAKPQGDLRGMPRDLTPAETIKIKPLEKDNGDADKFTPHATEDIPAIFYQHQNRMQQMELRTKSLIDEVDKATERLKITRPEAAQVWLAAQQRRTDTLPPRLREWYTTVKPALEQGREWYSDVYYASQRTGTNTDLPEPNDTTPSAHVPRMAVHDDKPVQDRYDGITGNGYSVWQPALEPRFAEALHPLDADGKPMKNADALREIYKPDSVSKSKEELNLWNQGKPRLVSIPKGFEGNMGDTIRLQGKDGVTRDYMVDHAWEPEIERAFNIPGKDPSVLFHKDKPELVMAKQLLGLGRARANLQLLEELRNDPVIKNMVKTAKQVKEDESSLNYRRTDLELMRQMNGQDAYYPSLVADVFDHFQKTAPTLWGDMASILNRVFMTFGSPVHVMNQATNFAISQGWRWLDPKMLQALPRLAPRAWQAVAHPEFNADYHSFLDSGGRMMYSPHVTADLVDALTKRFGLEVAKDPETMDEALKAWGMKAVDVGKAMEGFSKKEMWRSNDFLTMLGHLINTDVYGMAPHDSVDAVHRWLSNYRAPIWLGAYNSAGREAADVMRNRAVSLFWPWHYSQFKALSNMTKDLLQGVDKDARKAAVGNLATMAMLSFVAFPMLSRVAQAISGNKDAEVNQRGVLAVTDAFRKMANGTKDDTGLLRNVFSPSIPLQFVMGLFGNRDWTGRPIMEQGKLTDPRHAVEAAGQLGEYAVDTTISPFSNVMAGWRQQGATPLSVAGRFGAGMVGTHLPSPAETKYNDLQDKKNFQAQKAREKKPRGIVEAAANWVGRHLP